MYFNTVKFIDRVTDNLYADSYAEYFSTLDRLCKKIDVVKEVYIEYKHDLSKASQKEPLSDSQYLKLLKILMFYAKSNKDLKYLNSALKLHDRTKNGSDDNNSIEIELENILKYFV